MLSLGLGLRLCDLLGAASGAKAATASGVTARLAAKQLLHFFLAVGLERLQRQQSQLSIVVGRVGCTTNRALNLCGSKMSLRYLVQHYRGVSVLV